MKPRHAAALAVVGWYLVLAPRIGTEFSLDTPLSQWKRFGNEQFATEAECKEARTKYVALLIPPEHYSDRTVVRWFSALRCVGFDAPVREPRPTPLPYPLPEESEGSSN